MKIPYYLLPTIRVVVLAVFMALSALVLGYFWTGVGGKVPLVSKENYQFEFDVDRVNNLVPQSDIAVAGILVGNVVSITPRADGGAHVVADISDESALPLHEGVTGRVSAKTLVEETLVLLVDGSGPELQSGSVLPKGAIGPAVTIDDVLRDLPPKDRMALASTMQALGAAGKDTHDGVAGALKGLGALGGGGATALDALAKQSESLAQLTGTMSRVMTALDTREGQIVNLVSDADRVTEATAGSAGDIEQGMRVLPGLLESADKASDDISELANAIRPVAANLDRAAPDLNSVLKDLPATSKDLREMLPPLYEVLDKAPETFDRVDPVSKDLVDLMPEANGALAHLNPMVRYASPFAKDMSTFFTNFGQSFTRGDANGLSLRLMLIFHMSSFHGNPFPTNGIPPLDDSDPHPAAGSHGKNPDDSPRPDWGGKLRPSTKGEG